MNLAELLEKRSVGLYPMGEVKTARQRLLEIVRAYGLEHEQFGRAIAEYYENDEAEGIVFKLRRITKTEQDKLRAQAKKKADRVFNHQTRQMEDGAIDADDFIFLKLAYAIVEPEIPGDDVRAKADYLAENLTLAEAQELSLALDDLNSFNLRRAKEQVKN